MKAVVKLTVLFATLLMLSGIAFAADCHNYEYFWKSLNDPEAWGILCAELCFNEGEHSGTFTGLCLEPGNLVLFFDSMKKQALLYYPGDAGTVEVSYLKFHGDWLNVFTGIVYCDSGIPSRYFVRGHKVDECNAGM